MIFECEYCGEGIREGDRVWSVPRINGEPRGTLCCPECQLSYSKYLLDPYHKRREPLIRAQHHNHTYAYAPPPARVKRFSPLAYTPRSEWCQSREKEEQLKRVE